MNTCPIERAEFLFFCSLLQSHYNENATEFPIISHIDVKNFIDRITEYNDDSVESQDFVYDPLMEPLVQSSLAHFLYLKKNGMEMNKLKSYHPNYIRFHFFDKLVANKSSITISYLRYLEFAPSTTSMDREKFMFKIYYYRIVLSRYWSNPLLEKIEIAIR